MPTLVRKTLREYRRAMIGWAVGIGVFIGMYLSFYPQMHANPDLYGQLAMSKYPENIRWMLGGLESISTGAGFLQAVIYQLFVPMLFIGCAVVLGNRAVAAPEESGTLELAVTLPVTRQRLLLERFAALALALLAVYAVTLAVVAGAGAAVDLGVGFDRIITAHTGLLLLGLFFGVLTVAVGAATGRKAIGLAVAGVYAVAGFVVNALSRDVEGLRWLTWASPFRYYAAGNPLAHGFPLGDYLLLLGASVVLALTAVLAFDRRDVGV
ncbi:ABC transporter permease [Sphaerisporangium rufum]|uniref:ABC transporter permease n=1 Tax=Sphaerisporangium rufum TaxID=1381558 RepID=A0A919V670_9ACTN|nr:ABC transporter permease subunit [Sphaerisporangium rufum]GII79065.1 ABC transporter permease [Sphaerisporangium rufum]